MERNRRQRERRELETERGLEETGVDRTVNLRKVAFPLRSSCTPPHRFQKSSHPWRPNVFPTLTQSTSSTYASPRIRIRREVRLVRANGIVASASINIISLSRSGISTRANRFSVHLRQRQNTWILTGFARFFRRTLFVPRTSTGSCFARRSSALPTSRFAEENRG